MSSFAKRALLFPYVAAVGALLVDNLLGLKWFGRYDKLVFWGFIGVAGVLGSWLKSRREQKLDAGGVKVEALGADGSVRSDPKAPRFVTRVIGFSIALCFVVWVCVGYREHWRGRLQVNIAVLLVMVVIFGLTFRKRFGNISQVENDDGVLLTLSRGGSINQIPWSQIESVDVDRPYSFWQVVVRYRHPGEANVETARFLPMGWQKMTPAAAAQLREALHSRMGIR